MIKEYLGDGVYIEIEDGIFKLTTENGINITNTIYLDLEIYYALKKYVNKILNEHDKP